MAVDPVSTLITGRKVTSGLTDPSLDHCSSYRLLCSFSPPVSTTWNVALLLLSAWLTPAVFRCQVAMLPLPALFATSLRPPRAGCSAPAVLSRKHPQALLSQTFNFTVSTGLTISLYVPWGQGLSILLTMVSPVTSIEFGAKWGLNTNSWVSKSAWRGSKRDVCTGFQESAGNGVSYQVAKEEACERKWCGGHRSTPKGRWWMWVDAEKDD